MDRLRWTRPVVVADVLIDDTADVVDAQEDEMVERLLAQRSHESLDVGGCVGCAVGDR